MNKLFNKGDYVLLSDCKAFDEKYGLKEDATMWAVARKMQGGEPDAVYTKVDCDVCVGVYSIVGCWNNLPEEEYSTQLTVEDVLYRSEDGLTLDELSKIPGAFEDGKEYECVKPAGTFSLGQVSTYKGSGLRTRHGTVATSGSRTKFKPVTPKKQWVPSVGDEVFMDLACKKVKVEAVLKHEVCVSDGKELLIRNIRDFKPIDKEREATIKKVTDLSETFDDIYSPRDFAIALYDAGLLKR